MNETNGKTMNKLFVKIRRSHRLPCLLAAFFGITLLAVSPTAVLGKMPQRQGVEAGRVERLADAIDTRATDAMTYLAGKIRTHYIVGLGEDHWIKDHPQFLCRALHELARDTTLNVDVLAVEFGNSRDQQLADEFVASSVYRHDLVIRILRNAPDVYGNPYKEYADILRAVWESNCLKPEAHRTRILLLDPEFVPDLLDGKPYQATGSRDDKQFNLLRRELLRKHHCIFYAGLGHVGRRIWGQYMPQYDIYYNFPSTGFLLKACYPDQVCLLELWGARIGSYGYEPGDGGRRWKRLYGGLMDEAFRINGDRPAGFDLRGPALDTLTVARLFSTPEDYDAWDARADKGSPYRKEDRMCDYVDGILFIGPVDRFSGATVIGELFDEEFTARVAARLGEPLMTRKAIYEYIRRHHPIMSESLDALIEKEETAETEAAGQGAADANDNK